MSCVIPSDGACTTPKEYNDSLDQLTGVLLTGADDSFTITWDTTTSYATHNVNFMYRLEDATEMQEARKVVTRDSGTVSSSSGLDKGGLYLVWLRVETDTEYGAWQKFTAITDVGWDSNAVTVIHEGDTVFHGDDVVLYS